MQDDGSPTIPAGNLFAPGTAGARPEIFVMGVRNPFRIDYDPVTSALTWGDYGPDAGTANADRGPMGYVEWQSTTVPLNGGWPSAAVPTRTTATGTTRRCAGAQLVRLRRHAREPVAVQHRPAAAAVGHRAAALVRRPADAPAVARVRQRRPRRPWAARPTATTRRTSRRRRFPEYWDGKAFMAEFSRPHLRVLAGRPQRRGHEDPGLPAELGPHGRRRAGLGQRDRLRVRSRRFALRARLR